MGTARHPDDRAESRGGRDYASNESRSRILNIRKIFWRSRWRLENGGKETRGEGRGRRRYRSRLGRIKGPVVEEDVKKPLDAEDRDLQIPRRESIEVYRPLCRERESSET